MGYGSRNGIRTFTPDDTDTELYVAVNTVTSVADLVNRAQAKWVDIQPDEITITHEHIHTDCIGYDQYDSSDWTDYYLLTPDVSYLSRAATVSFGE